MEALGVKRTFVIGHQRLIVTENRGPFEATHIIRLSTPLAARFKGNVWNHRMIAIRKYQRADARAVTTLVSKTYWRFNSDEGIGRALLAYVQSFDPKGKRTEDIHERFSRTPTCFVALDGS